MPWQAHHPHLFAVARIYRWFYAKVRKGFTVVFATWSSMQNPIDYLLNVRDAREADKLTEKWTKGKLKELQFVGLSVSHTVIQLQLNENEN